MYDNSVVRVLGGLKTSSILEPTGNEVAEGTNGEGLFPLRGFDGRVSRCLKPFRVILGLKTYHRKRGEL